MTDACLPILNFVHGYDSLIHFGFRHTVVILCRSDLLFGSIASFLVVFLTNNHEACSSLT